MFQQDTAFRRISHPYPMDRNRNHVILDLNFDLMKRQILLFSLLSLVLAFTACQKEFSAELSKDPSQGSLRADGLGDCLPKNVVGTYEEGVALDPDSNYIEVEVDVQTVGTYTINTDTVNGMYFRASGIFTSPGIQTVKLPGNGTPFASGIANFVVSYDSTQCIVSVTTLPEGGGVPAEIQLDGAPGTCLDYVLAGSYITGTALNSSNTVTLKVDVITIGTYNISTTLSNGITFAGAGTLINTGPQEIILTGSGTPAVTGPTNIPITVGTSSCSFTVDVTGPAEYTIDCGSAEIFGNYLEGVELTADNEVTIDVNVTVVGGYNITGTINGMTFSAAGNFTATGLNTVTLQADGIPVAAGDFNVPLTGGTAGCNFALTVNAGFLPATGTWEFTVGGTTYSGIINGYVPESNGPYLVFYFIGENAGGDLFDMILADANATITATETYSFVTNQAGLNTGLFQFLMGGAGTTEYYADPSLTNNTLVATVNTHNVGSNPKVLEGTFAGNVLNENDVVTAITNGKFTVNY
jgi:hypothetical protein